MPSIPLILLQLITSGLTGTPFDGALLAGFTHEDWQALYTLSNRHDLAHMPGHVLLRDKLLPESEEELKKKFSSRTFLAVFRAQQLSSELQKLRAALSEAEIPFIPMKGSVLRPMYPQPFMRTSCDIDLLVKSEQLELAKKVCEEKLSYGFEPKSNHELAGANPSGTRLELHHRLIYKELPDRAEKLLDDAWAFADPVGRGSEYAFRDEFFYYYFMAHMSKHFRLGGCGIRPFMDLFVMRRKLPGDAGKRKELLKQGGLSAFAEQAERLSRVWFEGEEPTELTLRMEKFILDGGTYGTLVQNAAMGQAAKGGRFSYLVSKLWLRRADLAYQYPLIEKAPFLIPFCQIARWVRLLFTTGRQKLARENSVTDAERAYAESMLRELDLF